MMEWKASDNIKRTRKENILLLNKRENRDTWRNMWRQRSFCASGCPAILLMNPSRPARRSSMKSSSNIPAKKDVKLTSGWWNYSPSSPLNGSWRLMALLGNAGTTILLSLSNSFLSHSKSENRRLTLDSFTRNTGRFVCIENIALLVYWKYVEILSQRSIPLTFSLHS